MLAVATAALTDIYVCIVFVGTEMSLAYDRTGNCDRDYAEHYDDQS